MGDTNGFRRLSAEQVDRFRHDGYLKLGRLLDDGLVDLLRREYDREFALARGGDAQFRNLSISDTDDLRKKNEAPEQMLQIMQMCERNLHFRRLLFHGEILDCVEDLLGPNLQLFHDQALYKPAHHGGPVFWHQDNAYWQCTPANLVSCWLTLDDVTVANGAMQVIPGSHLGAMQHDRSTATDALLDNADRVDSSRAVAIELPAGGAMLHHCQTFHYTGPNETERERRAFAIHFMTPGTKAGRTGEYLGVSFGRPVLRMRV
ncbi:MAG: phytanoyl-CoA dioxygenase family protein [Spirochaetaceae bacterium]|nr:phytanoyl-CoA dioxygenase family protein [Spirochaetaceae bacterium]